MHEELLMRLAMPAETRAVARFFERNLDPGNDAIYSAEFFCPLGVRAAVRKQQVVVASQGRQIVGAVRFYKRKRDGIVSLYQFAVAPALRGRGLLRLLLEQIGEQQFLSRCPTASAFNAYYSRTGWTMARTSRELNEWLLVLQR